MSLNVLFVIHSICSTFRVRSQWNYARFPFNTSWIVFFLLLAFLNINTLNTHAYIHTHRHLFKRWEFFIVIRIVVLCQHSAWIVKYPMWKRLPCIVYRYMRNIIHIKMYHFINLKGIIGPNKDVLKHFYDGIILFLCLQQFKMSLNLKPMQTRFPNGKSWLLPVVIDETNV